MRPNPALGMLKGNILPNVDLKGGVELLKILHILFSIVALVLAGYGLITKDFQFQAYMILFLGLTMLLGGLREFKRDKKLWGWMLLGVFVFLMFVAIQSFMLNY